MQAASARRFVVGCTALVVAAVPVCVAAQEVDFAQLERADVRHALTPSLFYDFTQYNELDVFENFDLDDFENDDLAEGEIELEARVLYAPSEKIDFFLRFDLTQEFTFEDASDGALDPDIGDGLEDVSDDGDATELNLSEAYIAVRDVVDGLSAIVGRQSFYDQRTWLYDENIDAARIFYGWGKFGIEASVGRARLFDEDLLEGLDDEENRLNTYFLLGRYQPSEALTFEGYAFGIDDQALDGERNVFLGGRSYGAIGNLNYWGEASWVGGRGERDFDTGERSDISGFGFDAGATYVVETALEPSFTLAYAFGSGDSDPDDGTDNAFRQTGLHSNTASFNGFADFQYYGEALDPELSNLQIVTAGVGFKPTDVVSLDVVYHHYRQTERLDEGRDFNFDIDPSGEDSEIGHAVDLILGYRQFDGFDLDLAVGYFSPGDAFPDADDAFMVRMETELRF